MDKTQTFIEKAIKAHGDKYDYSKVEYINAKSKVIIICKIHGEFEQTPDGHISGRKCKQCSKEISIKKMSSNTEEFIKNAKLKHGDKYDYSKVIYTKSTEKVIIICEEHGEFIQRSSGHLNGYGCQKCAYILSSKNQKSNNEKFIQKAIKIHGDKYDYSKVNYIKNNIKVIIICKEHGEFLQTPQGHLATRGCNKCGFISSSNKQKSNSEEFIQKAKLIHGDKYDYSKVNYTTAINELIIICKIHGEFKQIVNSHLSNHGCQECANKLNSNYKKSNTKEFIEKAKLKHGDKYDYSNVQYINNSSYISIFCKKHGEFKQTPANHLYGFNGCIRCAKQFSKAQIKWLDLLSKLNNIHIQHAMNDGEFRIPTTRYKADGYCESTNTVYEFHGDYWHGNPNIFGANDMNKTCNKTHGDLYEQTLKKEQEIKDLGYNLITMWESDWNRINNNIKKIQIKFRHRFETH